MISSNINNYMFKCYLKFFKIVPVEMGGFNVSYANITVRDGISN